MGSKLIPSALHDKYEIHEWKHATTILRNDFPNEWKDFIDLLNDFKLLKSHIKKAGGKKSPIANALDSFLYARGWEEKKFQTSRVIDGVIEETPTHKIDCVKNRIALDIEWNNKDPFFDRDLNNFRLLFDLDAISVGVIITRSDELQKIFKVLKKGTSYGASTTHMSKLVPRINGGGAGGCPILVIGITAKCYVEDI